MDYELRESAHNRKSCTTLILNVIVVVMVGLITFFVVPLIAQVIRVQGDSMTPSLQGGQLLFVNRLAYRFEPLKHGDIIVFRSPQSANVILIKRVIGLPGERVSIRDGKVLVDNQQVDESYVIEFGNGKYGPVTISEDTVFVLGDHRTISNDSRTWGGLPVSNIIGRAEFSIWPPRAIS